MNATQSRSKVRLTDNTPERFASVRIEQLDLSVRSFNALKAHGIRTFEQLRRLSDEDLLRFNALGRKSLKDIKRAVEKALAGDVAPRAAFGIQPTPSFKTPSKDPGFSPGGWRVPLRYRWKRDAPVGVLDLSTRPSKVLARLQVESIRQLLAYPKQGLFQAGNIGRKSMAEIESKLFAYLSAERHSYSDESRDHESRPGFLNRYGGTKAFVNEMVLGLSERQRNVVADRYGLWDGISETLQDIGDKLGVTRERVRQIEEKGLQRLRRVHGYGTIRRFVTAKVRLNLEANDEEKCGALSEDEATSALADDCAIEEAALAVEFLRDIESPGENLFAHSLVKAEPGVYCARRKTATEYKRVLRFIELSLQHHQRPLVEERLLNDIASRAGDELAPDQERLARRILSVSPSVLRLRNGTVVFSSWTQFQRRDATTVAEVTLRLLGRPAHFREMTEKANGLLADVGTMNERTIHNALVTERTKFVWVKSGTYGLAAWGLKRPPYIRDRLIEVLSEARYPLPYWHLKDKVLEVCNCKEESVRMTLDLNPKLFRRFEGDQYGLRKHYDE